MSDDASLYSGQNPHGLLAIHAIFQDKIYFLAGCSEQTAEQDQHTASVSAFFAESITVSGVLSG